uniref:hypothetical protein n=1 Tax=Candidatus Phytoplasma sp. AldY-WA1 TaxID=2852100 RepID=UPI00254AF871
FAIITGSNFNFKLKEEKQIQINLLNKKDYLKKYKEQDPIENKKINNKTINKNNIIFSSETDINDSLEKIEKEWKLKLSLDDLKKNKFIVDYYNNEKYKNKNLSYIYFVEKDDILVLLFWNIKEEITIDTKELNEIDSFKKNLVYCRKNLVHITNPLYYKKRKINDIYFNPIYFDDICFDDKKSNEENYNIKIFKKILSSDNSYKKQNRQYTYLEMLYNRGKINEISKLNDLSPKTITFFYKD